MEQRGGFSENGFAVGLFKNNIWTKNKNGGKTPFSVQGSDREQYLIMRQLSEGRAVFGFPGPGVFISNGQPPRTLLSDAHANASTAVQPTRWDVLLIGVIPEKEKHRK